MLLMISHQSMEWPGFFFSIQPGARRQGSICGVEVHLTPRTFGSLAFPIPGAGRNVGSRNEVRREGLGWGVVSQ